LEDEDDEAWIAESDTIDRGKDLIGPEDNQTPSVDKHKWIADTGATSHMSGNQKLFIDLRPINSDRYVKTGGGRLDIKGVGTVKLIDAHHSRINLVNVLYVPDLPVNLLSVRAFCRHSIIGKIDENSLSFFRDRTLMMKAVLEKNLYIVKWFAKSIQEYALTTQEVNNLLDEEGEMAHPREDAAVEPSEAEGLPGHVTRSSTVNRTTSPISLTRPTELTKLLEKTGDKEKLYRLWHRRFGHFKRAKLYRLHEMTDMKTAIPCKTTYNCEVCDAAKIIKKSSKTPSTRRTKLLGLVSFNICGPLPTSRSGYKYFLDGCEDYSRKSWVLLLKDRKDVYEALDA
jgi:hypothetical protein